YLYIITNKEVISRQIFPEMSTETEPVIVQTKDLQPVTITPVGTDGELHVDNLRVTFVQRAPGKDENVFTVPLQPGVKVQRGSNVYFEMTGQDDDQAYFLNWNDVRDKKVGPNENFMRKYLVNMSNSNLKLHTIKSGGGTDSTGREITQGNTITSDPDKSFKAFYTDASTERTYTDETLSFVDSSGYQYEFGPYVSLETDFDTKTINVDTDFRASIKEKFPFYHPGRVVNSASDLGLQVQDSLGNHLMNITDSNGQSLQATMTLNSAKHTASYPVSLSGSDITLPSVEANYVMTLQGSDAFPYPIKSANQALQVLPEASTLRIDPVYVGDANVTGLAEPGASAELYADGYTWSTTMVADDGTFTLKMPPIAPVGTLLQVRFRDAYTHLLSTYSIAVKTQKPIVNPVKDKDRVVTGVATPGSTIKISSSTRVIGSATVPKSGKYSVTIPLQPGGSILLVTAGNGKTTSGDSSQTIVVTDTTGPNPPVVTQANDSSYEVQGTTERGAYVTVKNGTTTLGVGVGDENGKFDIFISERQSAGTRLTITATDLSGNIGRSATVIVKDTTAPDAPLVTVDVKDKDNYVIGTTEPYAKVTVSTYKDQRDLPIRVLGTGTADQHGAFKVRVSSLLGQSIIGVAATDKAGNQSDAGLWYVQDMTAPALPKIKSLRSTDEMLTVTAEPYSIVYVSYGSTSSYTQADEHGVATLLIGKQPKGEKISAYAVDMSGNVGRTAFTTVL
ncbi:MAG: Ig-like domain-containing protein, partial [Tumebacillaceae bacterium]